MTTHDLSSLLRTNRNTLASWAGVFFVSVALYEQTHLHRCPKLTRSIPSAFSVANHNRKDDQDDQIKRANQGCRQGEVNAYCDQALQTSGRRSQPKSIPADRTPNQ